MVTILILLFALIFINSIFKRYYPVKGIPCIDQYKQRQDSQIVILDIRDFNEAPQRSDEASLHIPYAYLRRYYKKIPDKNIHLIAQDPLELNLGLRFLARKGFKVVSYSISECPCTKKGAKGVAGSGI